MKSIFIAITLSLLVVTFSFAEKVTLNTPYTDKTITIDIPSDAGPQAKALIIKLAEMYWGERYDREKSQADVKKLQGTISDLKKQVGDLILELNNTQALLDKKIAPTPFILYADAGATVHIAGLKTVPQIGLTAQFFELFSLRLGYEFPDGPSLSLGIRIK